MAGMDPATMRGEWARHMAAMQGARGDSLHAMMPMHQQMLSRMTEMMAAGRGGMTMRMGMDSAWIAIRDSLHRDVERMMNMTPTEMEAFLGEHGARMRRMLELHQAQPQSEEQ
jgi:hypothetical protein